jgi:hypothetical protein
MFELTAVEFKNWRSRLGTSIEDDKMARRYAPMYYELSESRDHMRTQANTEKYKYLMTHQPELVGRVHDIHLASYLGIARSTLAREKARFTKGTANI